MWLRFVFHFLPTEGMRSGFRDFWNTYAFFIVKGWHVTEYTILASLVILSLKRGLGWSLGRAILVTVLLCFAYASSDEWHQTFVPPRDGCFRDVMIDMIGVALASLWFWKRSKKPAERVQD